MSREWRGPDDDSRLGTANAKTDRHAGYVLSLRPPEKENPTDDERMKAMAQGREQLVRMTGEDFGFDLEAWHEYLLTDENNYKHVYCWRVVRPAIEGAMDDPDRLRLVERLEAEGK